MSLRFQLILLVALALLLSLAAAGTLVWRRAAQSVVTEMDAALTVNESVVRNAVAHLPKANDQALYLEQLINTFDGDRHVRAALIDPSGIPVQTSVMEQPNGSTPEWFYRIVGVASEQLRMPLPDDGGFHQILLETDPYNEVNEVWTRFRDDMMIMTAFCGIIFLLVYRIVGHGLRPLQTLTSGFQAIAAGNYSARVSDAGPPELRSLTQSFNSMAADLSLLEAGNQRLEAQLLTIQEEERADLARDLHDEVGPFLFAVNVDVSVIARAIEQEHTEDVMERVRSIKDAVAHMQSTVRAILARLRPPSLIDVGLSQAVANLATFWQRRHPGISIRVTVTDDGLNEPHDAAIYRLIQESLSNAIRHGHSHVIDVSVTMTPDTEICVNISDDGVGLSDTPGSSGYGLTGMRERVAALGGILTIANRSGGKGTSVVARLPRECALEIRTELV